MLKLVSASLALSAAASSVRSVEQEETPLEFQQLSDFSLVLQDGKAHVRFTAFQRAYDLHLSARSVLSDSATVRLVSEGGREELLSREHLPTTFSTSFDDDSGFAVFSVASEEGAHVHGTVYDSVQGEHFSVQHGAVHHKQDDVRLMSVDDGRVVDAREAFAADAVVATREVETGSCGAPGGDFTDHDQSSASDQQREQQAQPVRRLLQSNSAPLDPWKTSCYPNFADGRLMSMGIALDSGFVSNFGGRQGAMSKMQTMVESTNRVLEQQLHLHMSVDSVEVAETSGASFPWESGCSDKIHNVLDSFTGWASTQQRSGADKSGWHLLSGCYSYGVVGVAWVGTLCNPSRNSGVSSGRGSWTTFAHEFGHNMGMGHTFQLGQGRTGSIMDYGRNDLPATQFYPADSRPQFNTYYSETEFCNTMSSANRRFATCQQEWGNSDSAVCGNGVVEAGEECDENTPCCSNCRLVGECHSDANCCNLSTCSWLDSIAQCNACPSQDGFPLTYGGKTASKRCNAPATGTETRFCNKDGSWSPSDRSACTMSGTYEPTADPNPPTSPPRTQSPSGKCPREYPWPEARPGWMIRRRCRGGYMSRRCQSNGWGAADTSRCSHGGGGGTQNDSCAAQNGFGATANGRVGYKRCPTGTSGYIASFCRNGQFQGERNACKAVSGAGQCPATGDFPAAAANSVVVLPCAAPEMGYRYRYCTYGSYCGEANACSLGEPALSSDVKMVVVDLDFSSQGNVGVAMQAVTTDYSREAIQTEIAKVFGVSAEEVTFNEMLFPDQEDSDVELTYHLVLPVDVDLPPVDAVRNAVQYKMMDGVEVAAALEVDLLEADDEQPSGQQSGAEACSAVLAWGVASAAVALW